jgi:hypothetical protein
MCILGLKQGRIRRQEQQSTSRQLLLGHFSVGRYASILHEVRRKGFWTRS